MPPLGLPLWLCWPPSSELPGSGHAALCPHAHWLALQALAWAMLLALLLLPPSLLDFPRVCEAALCPCASSLAPQTQAQQVLALTLLLSACVGPCPWGSPLHPCTSLLASPQVQQPQAEVRPLMLVMCQVLCWGLVLCVHTVLVILKQPSIPFVLLETQRWPLITFRMISGLQQSVWSAQR